MGREGKAPGRKCAACGKRREAAGSRSLDLLSAVDPVTYADRLKDRKVLMLNASNDEIIPRQCTESLWKAAGKPKIVWYDSGHVTAALHILDAMQQVTDFFSRTRGKRCEQSEMRRDNGKAADKASARQAPRTQQRYNQAALGR